ncbi:hypothetical protein TorRG33x02_291780 [Trema orientale]|uniref:Uncharacterized protein n=1 Tax=Trema orientale TaxID=63057 RepID=A0A2P5CAU4_TREOI|nr:hypothetical protein TorRG33x02_291780 [Trema orientale]
MAFVYTAAAYFSISIMFVLPRVSKSSFDSQCLSQDRERSMARTNSQSLIFAETFSLIKECMPSLCCIVLIPRNHRRNDLEHKRPPISPFNIIPGFEDSQYRIRQLPKSFTAPQCHHI